MALPDPFGSDDGSVLLEVIVAFAILSIAMIQGFDALSHVANTSAGLEERRTAIELAQNQLELARISPDPSAPTIQGSIEGGFSYKVEYAATGLPSSSTNNISAPYRLSVTVSRSEKEIVRLQSWLLYPVERQ